MPTTFSAATVGNAGSGGASSLTFAHTIAAGSNRLLRVGVGVRSGGVTVSSITYGGIGLTKLTSVVQGNASCEYWFLKDLNLTTGAANVVVSLSASINVAAGAVSFADVDQTTTFGTPVVANGTTNAPSVTVVGASGDLIDDLVVIKDNPTLTVGAGQTQRINDLTSGGWFTLGSSTEPGAASVVMSWSLSGSLDWSQIGVAIKAAAAAAQTSLIWSPASMLAHLGR